MDLKLLHMFTLPGGKQGRGSAGRAHGLTLYTNILLPFQILTFTVLHPWCLSCAVQETSASFPLSPGAAVSSLVSSGHQRKAENPGPAKPRGICDRPEPFHYSAREMAFRNNNDYVHSVPCQRGKIATGTRKAQVVKDVPAEVINDVERNPHCFKFLSNQPRSCSLLFPLVLFPPAFFFLLPMFDLESRFIICVMTAEIKDLCIVCMGI